MNTEILFILDRSGSMQGLEKETIKGFNTFLKSQKKQEGKAHITTILFDDQIEFLHDHVNIKKVNKITKKDYYVRGMTALLDAVGLGISKMIKRQKKEKADQVIVVISTDGYENASRFYSYSQIQEMINLEKEKYGWEFIFLGARIDAIREAEKIGIQADRAVKFYEDEEGVELSFKAANDFTKSIRACKLTDGWKSEVEKNLLKPR